MSDGKRVEKLYVAQSAATTLQIGLGAVRDFTAAYPPTAGLLDQFVEASANSGAPLTTYAGDEQIAQLHVTSNMAGLEHAERCRHVGRSHLQSLRHRAHAVIELDVGVPQWVPELVGDVGHDAWVEIVVQQNQIQVRERQQLTARQTTDRDDREARVRFDPQFGTLGRQPELVKIDQSLPQRRGIEPTVARAAVE